MNLDILQARSRVLRNLVTMVFVLLVLVLAIEVAAFVRGRYASPWLLAYRLPMLFYLWAIWDSRRAIASIGKGELFGTAVPRMLGRVGLALFLGGIVNVFGAPLLLWAFTGRGAIAYYDVAAITVGVVGLTLVLVAQLLAQAAAMHQELDEMF
jgi:hypothetical protein